MTRLLLTLACRCPIVATGFLLVMSAVTAPSQEMVLYDLTHLYELDRRDPEQARAAWDEAHFVASLQGIVNRDEPKLFVRFMKETDSFWLDHLRSPGEWLEGREVVEIDSVEELVLRFREEIAGLVVYSEALGALSNLASTIAGVEDRVCLRWDESPRSLYQRVIAMTPSWDVFMLCREDGSSWFTGETGQNIPYTDPAIPSTGSAKGDAYLWAKQQFLDTGKTSEEFLAFYIDQYWLRYPHLASLDGFTLTNHDFFISQRAFFFDLGVWEDERPIDDPGQPLGTDRMVLESILAKMAERREGGILHIGGFTPWMWKYTNESPGGSRHGAVATEWEKNKVASIYNAVIDSDALDLSGMANASLYQHFPMDDFYGQPPKPTFEDLRTEGLLSADDQVAQHVYVMFYQGDYDSAAWLNRHVPKWWQDPARGEIPLNWAFNPNLDRRAPHALDYARRRQTDLEWFIAGDSGAGYLNPGMLSAEQRGPGHPDGWEEWVKYCERYYEKFDLSLTGFVIDGASPGMGARGMDYYMKFSPHGFIGQKIPAQGVHRGSMPFIRMGVDFHMLKPDDAARRIAEMAGGVTPPRFLPLRTILKSPTWHKETMAKVAELPGGESVKFMDAHRFMLLLKAFELDKVNRAGPEGPYSGVRKVSFSASGEADGLHPVEVADGPFRRAETHGRSALHQRPGNQPTYVYFRVGDGFGRSLDWDAGIPLELTVSFWDGADGGIAIQYNTPEESYEMAGRPLRFTGSNRWREETFVLPGARLDHRQNGGASFRLVNFQGDLAVDRVEVRRVE